MPERDALILDFCKKLEGDAVVFGKLGRDYVNAGMFSDSGVKVHFQDYEHPIYKQRFDGFEPYMCILDLVFNHGEDSMNIIEQNNITIDHLRRNE